MKIYIDTNFICHLTQADGYTAIETDYFDGKCQSYIEGYRYVPQGKIWTRSDGVQFYGEMITPARNYSEIAEIQSQVDVAVSAQEEADLATLAALVEDYEALIEETLLS